MTSSKTVIKTTDPPNDDFFICRAFAKAISSEKLLQIIEQQPIPIEPVVESIPTNEDVPMNDSSLLSSENSQQWKIGDLCLCPWTEDGLLYKATIIQIDSSSCTVSFDDYGNEESHPLNDLQIRTEEEHQQQETSANIEEDDILPASPLPAQPQPHPPLLPPFPALNPTDDNDTLSSTLMSWYLAGYHTGFYQGIKNKQT